MSWKFELWECSGCSLRIKAESTNFFSVWLTSLSPHFKTVPFLSDEIIQKRSFAALKYRWARGSDWTVQAFGIWFLIYCSSGLRLDLKRERWMSSRKRSRRAFCCSTLLLVQRWSFSRSTPLKAYIESEWSPTCGCWPCQQYFRLSGLLRLGCQQPQVDGGRGCHGNRTLGWDMVQAPAHAVKRFHW